MITTTTPNIEGRPVQQYLGIVSARTIIGANFIKDFFASLSDFFGGRSTTYEKVIKEGQETALKELKIEASKLNADAIIGIDLDFETIGKGTMLMVVATGTAVRLHS